MDSARVAGARAGATQARAASAAFAANPAQQQVTQVQLVVAPGSGGQLGQVIEGLVRARILRLSVVNGKVVA